MEGEETPSDQAFKVPGPFCSVASVTLSWSAALSGHLGVLMGHFLEVVLGHALPGS